MSVGETSRLLAASSIGLLSAVLNNRKQFCACNRAGPSAAEQLKRGTAHLVAWRGSPSCVEWLDDARLAAGELSCRSFKTWPPLSDPGLRDRLETGLNAAEAPSTGHLQTSDVRLGTCAHDGLVAVRTDTRMAATTGARG